MKDKWIHVIFKKDSEVFKYLKRVNKHPEFQLNLFRTRRFVNRHKKREYLVIKMRDAYIFERVLDHICAIIFKPQVFVSGINRTPSGSILVLSDGEEIVFEVSISSIERVDAKNEA